MRLFGRILKNASDRDSIYQTSFDIPSNTIQEPEHKDYMPTEFDSSSTSKSIEEEYGDDLNRGPTGDYRVIVRREASGSGSTVAHGKNAFIVFDSPQAVYDMVYNTRRIPGDELEHFHQVMLAGVRRKLYFDIDFSADHFTALLQPGATYSELACKLIQAPTDQTTTQHLPPTALSDWQEMIDHTTIALGGLSLYSDADNNHLQMLGRLMTNHFVRYLQTKIPAYIMRCESSSSTSASNKFSVHLIIGAFSDHYLDLAEHANSLYQEFRVQDQFAALSSRFLDMGVYKAIQNLRICGCTKPNTPNTRVKRLCYAKGDGGKLRAYDVPPYDAWVRTLTTTIDGRFDLRLPPRYDPKALRPDGLHLGSTEAIGSNATLPSNFIELLRPYSDGFRVNKVVDNLVTFYRTSPSICQMCQRQHDADHTLYVLVGKTNYVVKCRRDNAGRKVVIPIASSAKRVASSAGESGFTDEAVEGPVVGGTPGPTPSAGRKKTPAKLVIKRIDVLTSAATF